MGGSLTISCDLTVDDKIDLFEKLVLCLLLLHWKHCMTQRMNVCSLHLLDILTTSHASALRKFTLWNTWQRPQPTTFHPNALTGLYVVFQCTLNWLNAHSIWFVFLFCTVDTINVDWMRIRYVSNAQCRHALKRFCFSYILLAALEYCLSSTFNSINFFCFFALFLLCSWFACFH